MHRLSLCAIEVHRIYRPDTTNSSIPQAVGDRRLSGSVETFQLTPRFHQTHLLWEPSSSFRGMAAYFQERLRA